MILFILLFTAGVTYTTFKDPVPVSQTSREIEAKALSADKLR